MSGVRRWPRVDLALNVRIRFANLDDLLSTKTLNISKGGIFIRMDRPRDVGTRVVIDALVGGPPAIKIAGVVVRVVPDPDDPSPQGHLPAGMGIHITDAPPEWDVLCEDLFRRRDEQDQLLDLDEPPKSE